MSTSSRGPRYREHLLAEGMHKILIRKAGQANGGAAALSNMKVVKFKEHAPKDFQLAATMEAVEGCGPPCAILNPRGGIEIQAQWLGAAGQKETATLSVGVKRALHCDAKLTFDDRVRAVFDSTATATADDLLATQATLAVLREELLAALDNTEALDELSGPRNNLEGGSRSRWEGATGNVFDGDGRNPDASASPLPDVEVGAHTGSPHRDCAGEDVPDNNIQEPMASPGKINTNSGKGTTEGGVEDSGWYSDFFAFPLYDSPREGTLGSAASRSTLRDESHEPTAGLDGGNTSNGESSARGSVADYSGRDSDASASPLSDSEAPPQEDIPDSATLRGTFKCDNQTRSGTGKHGVDRAGELPHEVQKQGHGHRRGSGTSQAPLAQAQFPLHPTASTGSQQTSGEMNLALLGDDSEAAKAREGSVDRPSSAAGAALPHAAPSMPADLYSEPDSGLTLASPQESPTVSLEVAPSRVASALASSGSGDAEERCAAPQHPKPEPRRLRPEGESGAARDAMEEALQEPKMVAALRQVDSDNETVFQVDGVLLNDDAVTESAPPGPREAEAEPERKVSTLRGEDWECPRCTLLNDEVEFRCGACGTLRPREEYHLRSIRAPASRFAEFQVNRRVRLGGSRRMGSSSDAQSGESQDGDDLGGGAASSQNNPTRRKTTKGKRAAGGRCTNGAGSGADSSRGCGQARVGRPRRGESGVGSPLRGAGHSNGAASEVASNQNRMVQVSGSPSSDGRIEPSAESILRTFVEWATTPGPSPFTLDTSMLAEEAARGLNDTKRRKTDRRARSGGNGSGAGADASSSPLPRRTRGSDSNSKRLSENDVPLGQREETASDEELSDRDTAVEGTAVESNEAPAGASEAEGDRYFERDGDEDNDYAMEKDVDMPSRSVEL